ncbi:hypothetical protein HOY34_17365 [Xinfangfangia sp. D13-10-4-6]|uniref:hypothetical protein n=1 Tax=Pseudogemmobacter hezensis TaxID=2737662 RepID=UPI00155598A8|nr:hypothetical protein [Pseudogemmobacter hezensis]NPD16964.1 hypothetical protein [Pseudogemmobacter hezensis]
MDSIHRFIWHEAGTGREDWLVLSAIAAAIATILGVWISAGGAQQVTNSLQSVISDAVNDIGSEVAVDPEAHP